MAEDDETKHRTMRGADDSDTVAHRIIYTICNPLSSSGGDPSSRRLSHESAFARATTTLTVLADIVAVVFDTQPTSSERDIHL